MPTIEPLLARFIDASCLGYVAIRAVIWFVDRRWIGVAEWREEYN